MRKLEVYIHIPFCMKKCHYCDFLSFSSSEEQQKRYFKALETEMDAFFHSEAYAHFGQISTIFIGGGTPSFPPAEYICNLLSHIPYLAEEVTIEANPGTLDFKKLTAYRKAGINRLSMGLQSSNNQELRLLGRIHTWEQFLENFEQARTTGFENINIDLMSGLPRQSLADWSRILEDVTRLSPEHISAYSLIIEEGTPFFSKYDMHPEKLPSEEDTAAMYELTGEFLSQYGYYQYEISNYAKPGRECLHNLGYWYRTDYIGFGLGASSLLCETRFRNTDCMEEYLLAAEMGPDMPDSIRKQIEPLTIQEQIEETMFLGLRCRRGISSIDFHNRFQIEMTDIYGDIISKYQRQGFLEWDREYLRLTEHAMLVSNVIMQDFLLEH